MRRMLLVALVAFAAGVASLAVWTAYRRHKAVVGVPPVSAVAIAPGVKLPQAETRASNIPPGFTPIAPPKPDTWQKDRECAAQAEETKGKKDGLLIDYEKSASELATFRRKIGGSERLRQFPGLECRDTDGTSWPPLPQERPWIPDHVRAARTFPIPISVSAITPNPTHRFIPSMPR
jgi:hypothetical protein